MIRSAHRYALALVLALAGCDDNKENAGPAPSDDIPGTSVTHFTEQTELFVEFGPLVRGQPTKFAAHLTRLSDFRPVGEGKLVVRLSGGGHPDETFEAGPSATPGIFGPVAMPAYDGKRQLRFELAAPDLSDTHDIGEVAVYATREAALAAAKQDAEPEPAGLITFTKEQQWKVDFATATVRVATLRESIPAAAVIRGRADGEAYLSAPAAGHVLAQDSFPRIGQAIAKDQVIAQLVPRLGGEQDIAAVRAELAKAVAEHDLAVSELRTMQQLLAQGAIPARRVEEARNREVVTRAALDAARARAAGAGGSTGSGAGLPLRSPIDGVIAKVGVGAGQYVEAGSPLFQIVDLDRLWLEAAVSEADSLRLVSPDGAWFRVPQRDDPFVISEKTGRLIAAGGAVDAVKRTLPVIFEFENPDRILRVGTFVTARIWTGAKSTGPVVPESALVDDAGQDVVFVLADGEHFERRIVRTGLADSGLVQIVSGLAEGERVVSRGSYLVRLAASRPTEAGHGHAH